MKPNNWTEGKFRTNLGRVILTIPILFLAHPNCVLFITHGGLLSTTEAVHYGKPIIGIPVFADQFANVQKAAEKGFGKRVELSYTMDAELKIQIDEILGNPK